MVQTPPLILSFDTSAAHSAVALLRGDRVLAQAQAPMTKGQAERLMPMVEAVLAEAGFTVQALDGIGVGVGPGNFTGLRIAVSAARGLALALRRPAIGVSGFEALAEGAEGPALCVIPAPRGAFYAQVHGLGDQAPVQVTAEASLRTALGAAVAQKLPILAWPDAVLPERDWEGFGPRIVPVYDLPVAIGRVALRRLDHPQPRPAPLYLRAADAAPSREAAPVILP